MLLLQTVELVDITKEIPLKYWILFIAVMAVILPLASKILTHMFIPQNNEEDAPVWSSLDRKNKGNKF